MKHALRFGCLACVVSWVLVSCAQGTDVSGDGPGPGDDGGVVPGQDGSGPAIPVDTTPYQITAATAASLAGMTADGYVVYHTSDGLYAVPAKAGSSPTRITSDAALAVIHGNVVFAYTNVDYQNNLGTLTVWTAAGGVKPVGNTLLSDDMVASSDDGSQILFTSDVTATTASLQTAPSNAPQSRRTLVTAMGRGSATTCRPSFGFAGKSAIAVWCADGSESAQLARYDAPTGSAAAWSATTIATDVQPAWVTDTGGHRVFFVTNASRGMVTDTTNAKSSILVDNGVTWATF
ncbi:MAG TPA: hypothetical protein VNO21_09335, partial [Polyangiaceae bacterium]|nr:hypothetical protein [Polyangiaceae bacterium]